VALVRKRTIPTERPPLSAKKCRLLRIEGVTWSAQRIPTAVNLGFLDRTCLRPTSGKLVSLEKGVLISKKLKKKGKAIPVTGREGP
jgi:hypothetical protein